MAFEALITITRNATTLLIAHGDTVRLSGPNGVASGVVFLRVDPSVGPANTSYLHVRSDDSWIFAEGATQLQRFSPKLIQTPVLAITRL